MKFNWDSKALRFRGTGGRFVRREVVTSAIEKVILESRNRVREISERLQKGKINLAQWQIEMKDTIRATHLLTAGIAQGGKAQLSPAALGRIGSLTRQQYEFLGRFARQIESGRQPLNSRFLMRAEMYARAARGTFSETERRLRWDAGFTEERNVLHASESCDECVAQSARGWVEVGSLSAIGSRQCRVNCRCELELRRVA